MAHGLSISLSPQGRLHVEGAGVSSDGGPSDDSDAAARRIAERFARGDGHGLFWLGASEPAMALSPVAAFWRELSRAFVVRLCATPDVEALRARVDVQVSDDELAALAAAAPPMIGGEYLTEEVLRQLCARMGEAVREELAAWEGTVEAFLRHASPAWNLVGRVCFHLAENKGDAEAPFAFVATYTTRPSPEAKLRHLPLAQALREYAGARNQPALLALLTPVQRAAQSSAVARELVDSGGVFETLAWTPGEAHQFLKEVPLFEAAGVVVRMPAAWRARRPPRPEAQVVVGKARGPGVGADALLDFSIGVTLEGQTLTAQEVREILAGTDGLALIRGRWIEIDRERLRQVLDHWSAFEAAHAAGGISVVEGLRLLAGARIDDQPAADAAAPVAEWSRVVAGESLARALAGLRSPDSLAELDLGDALQAQLRPYQQIGLRWLWWLSGLGLGGCLADDMGLGKTIQVIALFTLLKKQAQKNGRPRGPARSQTKDPCLLVVPASLIANWRAEIARFAPALTVLVAHPSELSSEQLTRLPAAEVDASDVVITSYGATQRLPWLATRQWDVIVLDEAQAIKNPGTQQTRAVKVLRGRIRLALTGTPVENRLGDLWSIFDFITPGLLGSRKAFGRFIKAADKAADGGPESAMHSGYGPLYPSPSEDRPAGHQRSARQDRGPRLLQPDEEAGGAVPAGGARAARGPRWRRGHRWHQASRRRAGVADAPQADLQPSLAVAGRWRLRSGGQRQAHAPARAGRRDRVAAGEAAGLHPVPGAAAPTGPVSRGRLRSSRSGAGGTGLNLTAARHVIHFDRWWNPAVENQATDRAYRIGQKNGVLVHKFICRGTVEEKIDALITSKEQLSRQVIEGTDEPTLTELDDEQLLRLVGIDINSALAES